MDPTLLPTLDDTRIALGPMITKPTLSTRMLAKPPVAFIFAVFVAVREATGFGAGLLEEEEDDGDEKVPEAPVTKKDKVRFLVRVIGCVASALGDESIFVRCSAVKVLAGEDPRAANALLQALACAAGLGASVSNRAVAETLRAGDAAVYARADVARRRFGRLQAHARGALVVRSRLRRATAARLVEAANAEAAAAMIAVEGAWALEAARRRNDALALECERECERRLRCVQLAEAHIRAQESYLEKRDAVLREREARALKLATKAKRELGRLKPLILADQADRSEAHHRHVADEDRQRHQRGLDRGLSGIGLMDPPLSSSSSSAAAAAAAAAAADHRHRDDASALHSARSRGSRTSHLSRSSCATLQTAASRKKQQQPEATAVTAARKAAGAGARYAAAARDREMGRKKKRLLANKKLLDSGDDGAPRNQKRPPIRPVQSPGPSDDGEERTPTREVKRAYAALGGQEGGFSQFLRDQLRELKAQHFQADPTSTALGPNDDDDDAPRPGDGAEDASELALSPERDTNYDDPGHGDVLPWHQNDEEDPGPQPQEPPPRRQQQQQQQQEEEVRVTETDLFERAPPTLPRPLGGGGSGGAKDGDATNKPLVRKASSRRKKKKAKPPTVVATTPMTDDIEALCDDPFFNQQPPVGQQRQQQQGQAKHSGDAPMEPPGHPAATDDDDYGDDFEEDEEDDEDDEDAKGPDDDDDGGDAPSIRAAPADTSPPRAEPSAPEPPVECKAPDDASASKAAKRPPRDRPAQPPRKQTDEYDPSLFLSNFDEQFNRAMKKLEGAR